ncbi:hypothetical protein OUZ56_019152 [Daphnia magna]|uniref:Uncharacterized protein n=1 Tax=Daphnia magna TaxID=35525 RepID=A0ABQ9ZAT9_9CRUS|nr:hypothetical protein OUZ56_019152 [Daphnia magna]
MADLAVVDLAVRDNRRRSNRVFCRFLLVDHTRSNSHKLPNKIRLRINNETVKRSPQCKAPYTHFIVSLTAC